MLGRLLWKPTPKRGPLHESHWTKPVEKGKGIGETKRGVGVGTTKQTTCTKQAANGTRQHDSSARRQIVAGERGYAGPRLRLRSHTLTSVNQR